MVSTLVLSHGNLAEALVATARTIAGPIAGLEALVLDWDAPPEQLGDELGRAIQRLDDGQGVLILTDMHGDTPTKLALRLRQEGKVEVVTGVNLPMVVRLSCMSAHHRDVASLAAWIREKGQSSICTGSSLSSCKADPCQPDPCQADSGPQDVGSVLREPIGVPGA